ncbi:alpha/beta fold hydrolase [Nocardia sp. NPDC056952]|uniref:alpha/beta fold hydrolase n=1 Tax=Nocardia sp. NPDC056952 TaxID=3345979 RepID=UPI0036447C46
MEVGKVKKVAERIGPVSTEFQRTVLVAPRRNGNLVRITRLSLGESRPALIFIPGFLSTEYTWSAVLSQLVQDYDILYVETHEKTARGHWGASAAAFEIPRLAADLGEALATVAEVGACGAVAASTGANLLIEAVAGAALPEPAWSVLVLPHERVPFPGWVSLTRRMRGWMVRLLQTTIVAVLEWKRRLIGLTRKQRGALYATRSAEALVVRAAALEWRKYRLDLSKVEKLRSPTLVVAASQDPMHSVNSACTIAGRIDATFVEVRSFKDAHDTPLVDGIRGWRSQIQAGEQ